MFFSSVFDIQDTPNHRPPVLIHQERSQLEAVSESWSERKDTQRPEKESVASLWTTLGHDLKRQNDKTDSGGRQPRGSTTLRTQTDSQTVAGTYKP
ncbi:UNVERIFIED_CONTAM: hypothetical protein FKN15_019920 [Acipenser sinensis]